MIDDAGVSSGAYLLYCPAQCGVKFAADAAKYKITNGDGVEIYTVSL